MSAPDQTLELELVRWFWGLWWLCSWVCQQLAADTAQHTAAVCRALPPRSPPARARRPTWRPAGRCPRAAPWSSRASRWRPRTTAWCAWALRRATLPSATRAARATPSCRWAPVGGAWGGAGVGAGSSGGAVRWGRVFVLRAGHAIVEAHTSTRALTGPAAAAACPACPAVHEAAPHPGPVWRGLDPGVQDGGEGRHLVVAGRLF